MTKHHSKRTPELPVLFLDVDGVLNCEADFRAGYQLCQRKVRMLNDLPPCDIVISSTWRIGGYDDLATALWWLGLKKEVVDATPNLSGRMDSGVWVSRIRGDEIEDWLGRNGRPRFAIVDDDSDMLPEQKPYFVQTNFTDGLTPAAIVRLSDILK